MTLTADVARLLAAYPALDALRAALHCRLREAAHWWRAPAGQVIFDAGVGSAGLPLVVEGRVRVTQPIASGHEILLYRLRPGEMCAVTLVAVLGGKPSIARGTAEEVSWGALLPRPDVLELVERHPGFRTEAFGHVATRLEQLITLLEEVESKRLDERLATALLKHGGPVRATHQAIADELGSTREVVSRILERFAVHGLVRLERGCVSLVDPDGLARVAGSRGTAPHSSRGRRKTASGSSREDARVRRNFGH